MRRQLLHVARKLRDHIFLADDEAEFFPLDHEVRLEQIVIDVGDKAERWHESVALGSPGQRGRLALAATRK